MRYQPLWIRCSFLLAMLGQVPVSLAQERTYQQEINAWRQERETRLQAEDGWLTIAGLYWLHEGANTVGTGPTNDLILPAGSAPAAVGVLTLSQGQVTFVVATNAEVMQRGSRVQSTTLVPGPGTGAAPDDALYIGNLILWLHKSGERSAIRLRDKTHPLRHTFTGCRWFPVDPTYRLTARFVAYAEPKPVIMANVLGDREAYTSPGVVEFTLQGQTLRLEPVSAGTDRLFFVFRDGTSGDMTYGAARFLTTEGPQNGQVVLDFNKTVNPPCAYNPFTTCPLPTQDNRLTVRIEAGELDYHSSKKAEHPTR